MEHQIRVTGGSIYKMIISKMWAERGENRRQCRDTGPAVLELSPALSLLEHRDRETAEPYSESSHVLRWGNPDSHCHLVGRKPG